MSEPREARINPDPGGRRASREGGYVLIWALFAFVLLGGLAAAALKTTGAERRISKASSEWNVSFYAAEVGLQQALGVATDTLVGAMTPGDSVDLGWQPIDGSTEYRAVVYRIDNGPQMLYQIRSTGRHNQLFGGETTVTQTMTLASDKPDGILIDDPVRIEGAANVHGECRVHARHGLSVPGSLTTDGPVSSEDLVDGNIYPPDGMPPESYADPIPAEPFDLAAYCAAADYQVRDGWLMTNATGDSALLGSVGAANWSTVVNSEGYSEYVFDADELTWNPADPAVKINGSFCADESVTLIGSPGQPGNPTSISLFTRGFVEVIGSPFVEAANGDGTLFATYGDIVLDGMGDALTPNYRGHLRARSECNVKGRLWIDGSLACGGTTYEDPPGVRTVAHENVIIGDLKLTTTCNINSIVAPRPITLRSWRHDY
jgi:hypothetical protein